MKIATPALNHLCPQTLYAFGTTKEDDTPNFGLFSWVSGYFDEEMGIMACLSGDKITKDRIHETKILSACLITEELLPFADYCGFTEGSKQNKVQVPVAIESGQVLDVPILAKSPWAYELEVNKTILFDNGEVFFCKIRNVLADERLCDETLSLEERMNLFKPVHSVRQSYFKWDGSLAGAWGEPMKQLL